MSGPSRMTPRMLAGLGSRGRVSSSSVGTTLPPGGGAAGAGCGRAGGAASGALTGGAGAGALGAGTGEEGEGALAAGTGLFVSAGRGAAHGGPGGAAVAR